MFCAPAVLQLIMPGYCVQGTVGQRVLAGEKRLVFDGGQVVDVRMQIQYLSFSAHADARGMHTTDYCTRTLAHAVRALCSCVRIAYAN